MSKPTSRTELIEWCKRKLGAPMLCINTTPEQDSDRIDEALEIFAQYHIDATQTVYYKHIITQEDVDNQYVFKDLLCY